MVCVLSWNCNCGTSTVFCTVGPSAPDSKTGRRPCPETATVDTPQFLHYLANGTRHNDGHVDHVKELHLWNLHTISASTVTSASLATAGGVLTQSARRSTLRHASSSQPRTPGRISLAENCHGIVSRFPLRRLPPHPQCRSVRPRPHRPSAGPTASGECAHAKSTHCHRA